MRSLFFCVLALLVSGLIAAQKPPLKLGTDDVVVFLGGTDMVRAQKSGHLETLLTWKFSKAKPRFRDLSWEADVVRSYYMLHTVEEQLIAGDMNSVNDWVQQDWEFHHATISACASPSLMAAHSNAFDRFIRYHMIVLDFRGRPAADGPKNNSRPLLAL